MPRADDLGVGALTKEQEGALSDYAKASLALANAANALNPYWRSKSVVELVDECRQHLAVLLYNAHYLDEQGFLVDGRPKSATVDPGKTGRSQTESTQPRNVPNKTTAKG